MKQLAVLLFLIIQITSCRTSEDASLTITSEPTIDLVFINTDSLNQLNDSTEVLNTSNDAISSTLTHIGDTLQFLNDSLRVINDAIEMGEPLEAAKASIESIIASYSGQQSVFLEEKSMNDSLLAVINNIKILINSGQVLVEDITIVESGNQVLFTDSASLYTVPLSFDKSFTQYSLTIDGEAYGFEVDYEIRQELDARRNVLLKASDITITDHTFLFFDDCEICTDGNATFTFHF